LHARGAVPLRFGAHEQGSGSAERNSTGRFLVACHEESETISVYAIDQASAALRLLHQYPGGKGANGIDVVSSD